MNPPYTRIGLGTTPWGAVPCSRVSRRPRDQQHGTTDHEARALLTLVHNNSGLFDFFNDCLGNIVSTARNYLILDRFGAVVGIAFRSF